MGRQDTIFSGDLNRISCITANLAYDTKKRIGALVDGESYYVRVDTFNENGITEGKLQFVENL